MHCIVNRIWSKALNAAGIQVKLTKQSLRAFELLVVRRACLKYAALCLTLLVCLAAQTASTAETAPATPAVPTSGPVSVPTSAQESAASGSPVEVRELWTGSLYSSTYRVGVCVSSQGKVRGVVQLRLYNGKVDVYHIDGTVQNNDIEAHHSSGHKFKGRLVSADTVEGVISLKNGMNVRLEGKRVHDVELAPEDCAPMPQ